MVLGGAASFLLKVDRPYIYCLSFPLVKKENYDAYGEYLYKIGISTQSSADKRLDQYLTYYSPFSYEIHYVLVFQKGTRRDIVKKTEQDIFDKLHALKDEARIFPTTARINRYKLQDRDSREWWETKLSVIGRIFRDMREKLKQRGIITYLVNPDHLNRRFSLGADRIPKEVRLNQNEASINKEEEKKNEERAKEYLLSLNNNDLVKRFQKPSDYFIIDKNF